jgi:hypothetical protein
MERLILVRVTLNEAANLLHNLVGALVFTNERSWACASLQITVDPVMTLQASVKVVGLMHHGMCRD